MVSCYVFFNFHFQATNLDTTVKIDVCSEANPASPTRQFKRIYILLGPHKKGFKVCLRDLLGLDGAFMKGPFPGLVLSAVVGSGFLEHLGDDLELGTNSNYTFISDRKKFNHYDREVYEWLKQIPPAHWARSHFLGRVVSDVLISNKCELFNGKIEKGRNKPVIGCLEYIREYLMKRICNVIKEMKKDKFPFTPTTTNILDA
uniref:Uncharacterized protein n=1 Tax=Lactuca sativa TaxID=4236 RepID=A0A9R1V1M8_LACSA|nr:hypothetical protein LSAT_V11C700376560 [Lactuca sativa]